MSSINILVAVDGQKLAQQVSDGSIAAGSVNSPTPLGSYGSSDVYISMITQNNNVDNNTQGDSELQIQALSGETLTWTITTFDNNVEQTAYLYASHFNPADAINPLGYTNSEQYAYLPPSDAPTSAPSRDVNNVYTFQGKLQKVGVSIQYTLSFVLVDNLTGNIIGHFVWDPFINVQ